MTTGIDRWVATPATLEYDLVAAIATLAYCSGGPFSFAVVLPVVLRTPDSEPQ